MNSILLILHFGMENELSVHLTILCIYFLIYNLQINGIGKGGFQNGTHLLTADDRSHCKEDVKGTNI
jgi:hypothetical protein